MNKGKGKTGMSKGKGRRGSENNGMEGRGKGIRERRMGGFKEKKERERTGREQT